MADLTSFDEEQLQFILDGEAESEGIEDAEVTNALEAAARKFENAAKKALKSAERAGIKPKEDVDLDDVWDEDAAYNIYMTLTGAGVGIWDGRWDDLYEQADLEALQRHLKRELGSYADDTGGGSFTEAFRTAAHRTGEGVERNPACGRGEIKVQRKGYKKHAYTTKKGTHVSATRVPPTTFCAEDRGKPGRTSRGAKAGPHSGEAKWIQRKGKLGGAGYTEKSAASRHKILDACVKKYGYRSCLGSIMVLERDSEISSKAKAALKADRAYLERKYGGPGSFGPRKNPEMSVPDVLALYGGAPDSAASQTAQIKRKLMS